MFNVIRAGLVALLVLWAGASHAQYANQPVGSTILIDCPFNGAMCPGIFDVYNSSTYFNDPTEPVSPPGALEPFMAVNSTTGSGQWVVPLADVKELYVSMPWSTNAEFMGYSNNNNKMLFARRPEIDNNFLVWQGGVGAPKTFKWYMQATYDNCGHPGETGMCFSQGDGTGWFEPNTAESSFATVAAGTGWHRIEFYIKTSTTKTSRDGVVKWWIDGHLVGNYPTINISPGGLQEFQINHTWDGSLFCGAFPGRDCTKRWAHRFGHLRIALPQCVGACVTPEPEPEPDPEDPVTGEGVHNFTTEFSGVQGGNQWSYLNSDDLTPLTWYPTESVWRGIEPYRSIWNTGFVPGYVPGAMLRWTAPSAGTVTINGVTQLYATGGDGGIFTIKKNNTSTLFSADVTDGVSFTYSPSVSVASGDTIDFIIDPKANGFNDIFQLTPVITFESSGGGVSAPTVSSLTPNSGDVGLDVVIAGTNFGTTVLSNTVKFSGVTALCSSASTTSLTCKVPQGATTGTVSVLTVGGTGVSGGSFTVTTATPTRTVRVPFSYSGLDVDGNIEAIDHFNVYRATTLGGTYSKVGEVAVGDRVYLDTDAPITRACYKIEAEDEDGNLGAMSPARCAYNGVSADADTTDPQAPFAVVPAYQ